MRAVRDDDELGARNARLIIAALCERRSRIMVCPYDERRRLDSRELVACQQVALAPGHFLQRVDMRQRRPIFWSRINAPAAIDELVGDIRWIMDHELEPLAHPIRAAHRR